ncbi:MAG: 2-dehydropantoate 2-reductase [Rhizobiales bacterium]|nr:2-dehydropantoate 2-reductase [Hyphomicrobiales bacterium]
MRIATMATGGVGGYFGARLADAGHDVFFIARGAHLDAIRKNGLKVDSPLGNLQITNATATDDPKSVGPVDVVLFAVKLWDTEKAGEMTLPLCGPNTRVITLQNGIDSVERLSKILGADRVIGGTAQIATVIAGPGHISHTSQFARIRCGRTDGELDAYLGAFVAAAKKATIDIDIAPSIMTAQWEKFVFLVGMSALTAATRQPMAAVLGNPEHKQWLHDVMAEVVAVGQAKGAGLPANFTEDRMQFLATVPPGMKASMAHDLERGNRMELDWLSGKVVALGRELGIPTPANERAYKILEPHKNGK